MSHLSTRHLASAGFESARTLAGLTHGHSFLVQATAKLTGIAPSDAFQSALEATCASLSYKDLEAMVGTNPSDTVLVQWLRQQLKSTAVKQSWAHAPCTISLRSAPNTHSHWHSTEADCTWVARRYHFEAAHQLPNVPAGHKCGRMHGHGFSASVVCRVPPSHTALNPHAQIDQAWRPFYQKLHHACLNDIKGLENPTSEHLALWLWQGLKQDLDLVAIAVNETPTAGCVFNGTRMRIWKEQTLDSAVRLVDVKSDDPRRAIHGHTFKVRLHLSGALDQTLGWVYDFGDVKTAFSPIFERLDHHPLYEIAGLEHADDETLAHWIHKKMKTSVAQLSGVDVEHQKGKGVWVREDDCFDL